MVGVVSAKVLADGHHSRAALAASGSLPENVNYAVKHWQGGAAAFV